MCKASKLIVNRAGELRAKEARPPRRAVEVKVGVVGFVGQVLLPQLLSKPTQHHRGVCEREWARFQREEVDCCGFRWKKVRHALEPGLRYRF